MTRETTLARGRAFLEPSLIDACLIERLTDEFTNADTGVITSTYATVYAGRCQVKQAGGSAEGQTEIAEAVIRIGSFDLKLPVVGSEGLLTDDRVTITAAVNDTDLVGRQFWLTSQSHATAKTTRRLAMSEKTD